MEFGHPSKSHTTVWSKAAEYAEAELARDKGADAPGPSHISPGPSGEIPSNQQLGESGFERDAEKLSRVSRKPTRESLPKPPRDESAASQISEASSAPEEMDTLNPLEAGEPTAEASLLRILKRCRRNLKKHELAPVLDRDDASKRLRLEKHELVSGFAARFEDSTAMNGTFEDWMVAFTEMFAIPDDVKHPPRIEKSSRHKDLAEKVKTTRAKLKGQEETSPGACSSQDLISVEGDFQPLWKYPQEKFILWIRKVLRALESSSDKDVISTYATRSADRKSVV